MKRIWSLAAILGLLRSIKMYYLVPFHARRLKIFYAQFIQPGDVVFDIGAHVGSRLRVFGGIGAQVIALEPQPLFMRFLKFWYGRKANLIFLEQAVGAGEGQLEMLVSERTPTVSSLSDWWVDAVKTKDATFSDVDWNTAIQVQVSTLDTLIAEYGLPAFCKIDVEGYEHEVLKGLSQPLPALSVEYIATTMEIPFACIDLLDKLGDYEYNYTVIEETDFSLDTWVGSQEIKGVLRYLPPAATSGDVYARWKRR